MIPTGALANFLSAPPDPSSEFGVRQPLCAKHSISLTQVCPMNERSRRRPRRRRGRRGNRGPNKTDSQQQQSRGPNMMVDEEPDALGSGLQLPPWLEERRETIEGQLTPLA